MKLLLDESLHIEVIHSSKRRTGQLSVEGGFVKVVIPKNVTQEHLQKLLESKKNWIFDKIRVQSEYLIPKVKEYVSGESFSYLGKNYRLHVNKSGASAVKLKSGRLEVSLDANVLIDEEEKYIRQSLIDWYVDRATERLHEKTSRYAKILGVTPRTVEVSDFKSRWGSCSIKGDIAYNWRIIIAPHRIVDYVVVHELAHMVNHDHSADFWKTIEKVLPDYRERKEWLKWNGLGLKI
jgi:predicted metal-dependent hydrolase